MDIRINKQTQIVTINGKEIFFTYRELQLFLYLYTNKNTTLTAHQILDTVWNGSPNVVDTIVRVYMGYIRKKLKGTNIEIKTYPWIGYRLTIVNP